MGIRTLLYLFRLGLKNLWHHRVYTAASVITMSACIFLFGLFYLAAANVDSMVKKTEQEVYVAVFFDEGILSERVEEIGNLIQSRPEVLRTVYVSADEAWSGFKEKYYENAEALDGIFETDNPLASSGNYQVYIDRIGSQEGFVEYVQRVRLQKAERLLRETDDPVGKIALDVGFGSGNYFTTEFGKLYHTTPQKYRKGKKKKKNGQNI